ncbi:MAG TPA: TolC family protein [Candidatus Binatia bacterium]|nr:TolC family protein [Candidatus Binatia bacterium]
MARRAWIAAVAAAWLAAVPAASGAAASDLRLEEALERALGASPEIRAAQADVDAARGRAQQAGLYVANPVLTAEAAHHGAPGGEEQIDRMFSLAQEIEIGGQRALRVAAADRDVEHARLVLADRRRRVLADVRRAFAAAVAAERREHLASMTAEASRRLAEATGRRERAGDATALDAQLAALEATRSEQARAAAGIERERAIDRLALAIGAPDSETVTAADGGDGGDAAPLPDDQALVERALASRPDLAAARAERARLEGEAAYVKRHGEIPNPVVRGYYRNELLDETVVGGEVAIPLPVWNREQGTETALRASASGAGVEIDRLMRAIPREVRLAAARHRAAALAWGRFRREGLPGADAADRLIERAYGAGYSGLTEALAQRDRVVQLRSAAISAWLDLEEARADVIEAVGGDPF